MDSDELRTVVGAMIQARHAFEAALDPAFTLIAIDLLLVVGHSAQFDRRARVPKGPTVKELFAQIPHSNRGARIHFNRLVSEGYMMVEPGDQDRRTRIVRLTARGEQVLRKAAAALMQSLEEVPSRLDETAMRSLALQRTVRPLPDGQTSEGAQSSASS